MWSYICLRQSYPAIGYQSTFPNGKTLVFDFNHAISFYWRCSKLDHEFLLPHLCFLSGYSYYSLYWLCVLFGTQVPAASCLFFLGGFEYPGVRIQGTRPKKYIKTPRASARVTQYIGSFLYAPFCWGWTWCILTTKNLKLLVLETTMSHRLVLGGKQDVPCLFSFEISQQLSCDVLVWY